MDYCLLHQMNTFGPKIFWFSCMGKKCHFGNFWKFWNIARAISKINFILGSYNFLAYLECVRSYAWSKGHSDPNLSSVYMVCCPTWSKNLGRSLLKMVWAARLKPWCTLHLLLMLFDLNRPDFERDNQKRIIVSSPAEHGIQRQPLQSEFSFNWILLSLFQLENK